MRKLIGLLVAILIGFLLWRFVWSKQAPAEDTRTQATVNGQVLESPRFAGRKLEFAPELKYAGGHRFQLQGLIDAEQHYWIEADEKKRIKRMFWIQYRDSEYTLDTDLQMNMWGLRWDCAKNLQSPPQQESDPEADHARMRAYLRSKGYTWPPVWLRFRMISADEKEKDQIMIWFMEDQELLTTRELDLKKMEAGDKDEVARSAYVRQDPDDRKRWQDWNSEQRIQQKVKVLR